MMMGQYSLRNTIFRGIQTRSFQWNYFQMLNMIWSRCIYDLVETIWHLMNAINDIQMIRWLSFWTVILGSIIQSDISFSRAFTSYETISQIGEVSRNSTTCEISLFRFVFVLRFVSWSQFLIVISWSFANFRWFSFEFRSSFVQVRVSSRILVSYNVIFAVQHGYHYWLCLSLISRMTIFTI